MTVTKLPGTVSPGAPAGYQVVITNNGPSNISKLYLVTDFGGTPVYLTNTQGSCNATGPLSCSFGALNAGQSVTTVVGYTTPGNGSAFSITFEGNTTGSTFSDVKGRSHGDLLLSNPVVTSTALNGNKNFAGFFSTGGTHGIGTSDQLTASNKQSTRLDSLAAGFDGTVSDGSVTSDACISNLTAGVDCTRLDGETSVVNVNHGADVPGGFFVIIHYKNGLNPVAFVHTYGSGSQEKINACGATITAPCFTWDAATKTATIYTLHNGSYTKLH